MAFSADPNTWTHHFAFASVTSILQAVVLAECDAGPWRASPKVQHLPGKTTMQHHAAL